MLRSVVEFEIDRKIVFAHVFLLEGDRMYLEMAGPLMVLRLGLALSCGECESIIVSLVPV